jgi:hypothetical protein
VPYWVFGWIGGFVVTAVFLLVVYGINHLIAALLALLGLLGWQVFISVAIWRSAGKYKGAKGWAVLARAVVVLGGIYLVWSIAQALSSAP